MKVFFVWNKLNRLNAIDVMLGSDDEFSDLSDIDEDDDESNCIFTQESDISI